MNNANKLPKGQYDPLKMVQTGDLFFDASVRCLEQRKISENSFEMLMVPAIVNKALSCEIFLKALLIHQGIMPSGKGNDLHNLLELWKQLPGDIKSKILQTCHYDANEGSAFEKNLEPIALAFFDWRYIYEYETINLNLQFLDIVATALQETADNIIRKVTP